MLTLQFLPKDPNYTWKVHLFTYFCHVPFSILPVKLIYLNGWGVPSSVCPPYTVNLVAWMFSACFVQTVYCCGWGGGAYPDVQGRIEATTALLSSSQGPRVCVIRPFSQLIPCWADNELGQGAARAFLFFLSFFFTPSGTGLDSYVCFF